MSNKQKLFDLWANRHGERFHRQSSKSIRKIFHIQKVWDILYKNKRTPRIPKRCRKYKPVSSIVPIDLSMSKEVEDSIALISYSNNAINVMLKRIGITENDKNAIPSKNIH